MATDAYKAHPPMRRQPPLYELTSQVGPCASCHDFVECNALLPPVSAQRQCGHIGDKALLGASVK